MDPKIALIDVPAIVSDWQYTKLSRGLMAYRLSRRRRGIEPSWENIRDQILDHPSTLQQATFSGKKPAFKFEALRRFAEGFTRTIAAPHATDIAIFLISHRILSLDELNEDKRLLEEALIVKERIGSTNAEMAAIKLSNISTHLRLDQSDEKCREEIDLEILDRPAPTVILLEERFRLISLPTAKRPHEMTTRSGVRRGYCFASGPDLLIRIYMRDKLTDQIVEYGEVLGVQHGLPRTDQKYFSFYRTEISDVDQTSRAGDYHAHRFFAVSGEEAIVTKLQNKR